MIDLDQLKGTTRLIAGFDRFLGDWLQVEPSSAAINWDADEWEFARDLPPHVREFYDVVQRWPGSKIVVDNNQDHLHFPPQPKREWNRAERAFTAPDPHLITIASENQDNWQIWFSNPEADRFDLYINADLDMQTFDALPMTTPIEEFLVTIGMHELIVNGEHVVDPDTTVMTESRQVFTGHYAADSPLRVMWHPDGFLWFEQDSGTEKFVWCSTAPQ